MASVIDLSDLTQTYVVVLNEYFKYNDWCPCSYLMRVLFIDLEKSGYVNISEEHAKKDSFQQTILVTLTDKGKAAMQSEEYEDFLVLIDL